MKVPRSFTSRPRAMTGWPTCGGGRVHPRRLTGRVWHATQRGTGLPGAPWWWPGGGGHGVCVWVGGVGRGHPHVLIRALIDEGLDGGPYCPSQSGGHDRKGRGRVGPHRAIHCVSHRSATTRQGVCRSRPTQGEGCEWLGHPLRPFFLPHMGWEGKGRGGVRPMPVCRLRRASDGGHGPRRPGGEATCRQGKACHTTTRGKKQTEAAAL